MLQQSANAEIAAAEAVAGPAPAVVQMLDAALVVETRGMPLVCALETFAAAAAALAAGNAAHIAAVLALALSTLGSSADTVVAVAALPETRT